jgi:hypothetical protein
MNGYDELLDRVKTLTGLNDRAAQAVTLSMLADAPNDTFSAGQIVKAAERLGYDFERPEGIADEPEPWAAEITMDPAIVLSEVYENSPRVLCSQMPRIGKAPDELQQLDPDLIEQLPDEVRALLLKIDVFEGKATFWMRDEANELDRPIGPIDLRRYSSGRELIEGVMALLQRDAKGVLRLDRVISADFN